MDKTGVVFDGCAVNVVLLTTQAVQFYTFSKIHQSCDIMEKKIQAKFNAPFKFVVNHTLQTATDE